MSQNIKKRFSYYVRLKEGKMYSGNDAIDNMKDKILKELDCVNCNNVALDSGYSIKQTNRIFSAQTGMNLGEFIRYRKLAQAIWELRYTDMNIIQIAQNNGFETQESFTRAFKTEFHITPHKFREYQRLECNEIGKALNEVIEEASHDNARSRKQELPEPNVQLIYKPQSIWYSIKRNVNDLYPHNFYISCQKEGLFNVISQVNNSEHLEGVYLTHIYKKKLFTSLTLGFELEYRDDIPSFDGFEVVICPPSKYLMVNVPPHMNYELGGHVLAAWNVLSSLNYSKYNLKRALNYAPIFELDSAVNGYTLFFPITTI
jgi:AraC-like DNA-binding protein